MRDRGIAYVVAIVVPVVAVLTASWYDAAVLVDIKNRASQTYDFVPALYGLSAAYILTGASAVAIAGAAWFSRSIVVGLAYALVGGSIALLPALVALVAWSVNGQPTLAPEPIATFLTRRWTDISMGVTSSVFALGATMLVSGVAVIAARLVETRRAAVAQSGR